MGSIGYVQTSAWFVEGGDGELGFEALERGKAGLWGRGWGFRVRVRSRV